MKVSTLKDSLDSLEQVTFVLPNGSHVPPHFHVTEVGIITKHYVDSVSYTHLTLPTILLV